MTTYEEIADYFIALSNSSGSLITNLKLQKLVYYTQAWHLAVYKCEIFEDDFQAWIHGPVLPALYEKYKGFQWRPIVREDLSEESIVNIQANFSPKLNELLEDIVQEYFSMDAYALEKSTHGEQPWIEARQGLSADAISTKVIKKESMLNFYSPFVTV